MGQKHVKLVKVLVLVILLAVLGVASGYRWLSSLPERPQIAGVETKSNQAIRGLIVPHHLLTRELLDQTFEKVAQTNDFQTIIILGPNHYNRGDSQIIVSSAIDSVTINGLPNVEKNSEIANNEHSISILLPYLDKYFPNASILPLIFTSAFNLQHLEELADRLSEIIPPDTLIVASVDFSHQCGLLEGLDKNQESIRAIKDFDYSTIYRFGNDHLDSPPAIATLLMIMEKMRAKDFDVWENSHGAILKNDPGLQGTSYVIGVFERKFYPKS